MNVKVIIDTVYAGEFGHPDWFAVGLPIVVLDKICY
jgi:hypothetical protein